MKTGKLVRFTVSAPGKVILFGEHAVLYNSTAIVASVDMRTSVTFVESPPESDAISVKMPQIGLNTSLPLKKCRDFVERPSSKEPIEDDALLSETGELSAEQRASLRTFLFLMKMILSALNETLGPFEIVVDGDMPIGSGVGSSAAFAVTLAAAFYAWTPLKLNGEFRLSTADLEVIFKAAHSSEMYLHGTSSGVDSAICTYGSVLSYRRGQAPKSLEKLKDAIKVLLVDTRISRNTKNLVKRLGELADAYPLVFSPIFTAIDGISTSAIETIQRVQSLPADSEQVDECYGKLMTLIETNQHLLEACQASHPTLADICATAKEHGLAAKLTGAGGGGYAYVFLLPSTKQETIDAVGRRLTDKGYGVRAVELGTPGVRLDNVSFV